MDAAASVLRTGNQRLNFSGLLIACVALSSDCARAFEDRALDFQFSPSRLVVLPVVARVVEVDAFGQKISNEESAEAMAGLADAELNRWAREKGTLPFLSHRIESCGPRCARLLTSYIHWGTRAALQIASGMSNDDRASVADWTSLDDYYPLQKALGAEYALIIVLRDIRETAGRHALQPILGGTYREDRRVTVACIASIGYAQMKWCNTGLHGIKGITRSEIRRLLSDL